MKNILLRLMSYRRKMNVKDFRLYDKYVTYPLCPRCGCCIEKEYVKFCNGCGQHLGWKFFADIFG